MRTGMLVFEEMSGVLLFTGGSMLGDSFLAGLMVGASLVPVVLLVRERDEWPSWFQNFSLLFSGVIFILGNCWLLLHGKGSSPPLITFGPAFLLMAAYDFAKQKIAART